MYLLTSLGMVNALGSSIDSIRERLVAGDTSGIVKRDGYLPSGGAWVGEARDELPSVDHLPACYRTRLTQLTKLALDEIAVELDELKGRVPLERIGIVSGSSTAALTHLEERFEGFLRSGEFSSDYLYGPQELGYTAEIVAALTGARGPCFTVSTACSSSAKAFASARRLIAAGLCDAVIVGGADSLCRLTVNGFQSLELVAPALSNPLSRNRCGLNIGEGAAYFIMERAESRPRDGAVILAGVGDSSDAYHISSPEPEGRGAREAIERALSEAGASLDDVGYLNLHGTGTTYNDLAESRAVNGTLGERVPCSSTKPLTGHLLGAAGATEIGFLWLMLTGPSSNSPLPPHRWDGERDEALAPIAVASDGQTANTDDSVLLSLSCAFGGSNCCVALRRAA